MLNSITTNWQKEFKERIYTKSKSRKSVFTFNDAVERSDLFSTDFDKLMIKYVKFIKSRPLENNDYFKYVNSYFNGRKLDQKYFKNNVSKLQTYYRKIEANPKFNPFSLSNYNDYVLYMMLKLNGHYKTEYNAIFNIKTVDFREYSPLSKIPSVLRANLPFKVKEFDIARAYPTFIDRELKIINREKDIYTLMDKVKFNTLLNQNISVKDSNIGKVRNALTPIYGKRVNEVITETRFNEKGRMFRDMVHYEKLAIEEFVTTNNIKNFARLHDGIFVLDETEANIMTFNDVKFTVKRCLEPRIENDKIKFYTYDSSNNLITSPKLYADFFKQEKFIRGCEDGNDKLIVFKDTNNVVSPFNYKTETVKYLKSQINETDFSIEEIENRIAKENNTHINQGYLLLDSKNIEYHTDNNNQFGLSFKNGFFQYNATKNELEQLKYDSVNAFFTPHRTQKHTFSISEDLSEFQRYLVMVSVKKDIKKDNLTEYEDAIFKQFCKMFGYLCHSYKNRAFCPAIILTDQGANDISRNGGRGKTIFVNALQHVQPSIIKAGNEFNPSYIHNFADLKKNTRNYIIDDVPASFNYNELYTNISGSISCQPKGTEAIEIPFSKAPKFVITSNWSVRYNEDDASTNRRFFEFKFTDFFNINNTPLDVFGHLLFNDWDNQEWNRFYNFVYYCVGSYLNDGLERIPYNKKEDNFKAVFNNDVLLNEFERVFNLINDNRKGFNVTDFLKCYEAFDNPLKYQKLFTHKSLKSLINTYIAHHNLPFTYKQSNRKWIIKL